MKRLKTYEAFGRSEFNPEMISEQEYTRVKKTGIHLRFSAKDVARLYHNSGRGGPGNFPKLISWSDGNQRGYIGGNFTQIVKNVELRFSTRFEIISIDKDDEPFVYFWIIWGYRNSVISWRDTIDFPPDTKLYGRMEYEEFDMLREDSKLWKDFCVNVVVEEDRRTNKIIQESFGGSIPDPEQMSEYNWDQEMDIIQIEEFTKNEQDLFKSLCDKINPKYRKHTLIDLDQLLFMLGQIPNKGTKSYMKGSSGPTYGRLDIVKNDDEFYYVELWKKQPGFRQYYKCDGFECFKNFLNNIFDDFRGFVENLPKRGRKSIKESFGGSIPDPEPMSNREWTNEVTDAEEVPFNQKDKELFIALSDSISLENKYNQPTITRSSLSFNLINGLIDPKLRTTTIISSVTTYKNDDEFYYVAVWEKTYIDEKLYRCDGYECWEKFLKDIFQGYRELTKQNKTNESFFNEVPDPEPMNVNEWDEEVSNAKEVDFNQREKELFIALADTIPSKHKINMPDIGDVDMSFSLVNGYGGIYTDLKSTTGISRVTTYKNEDEFYYMAVWEKGSGEKLYRCDGYACWEKFLKEIFAGYRELTKQTKTNESIFNEVPEPELIDVDEWDKVVIDKEIDFSQKEKEFFIDLADTIPQNNNIDSLYIEDYQLTFSMSNGKDPIYPNIKFDHRVRSITSYKNDDEFYYVSVWEYDGTESTNELYRCDGYKCWEKFLREIFEGYRKLTQTSQA